MLGLVNTDLCVPASMATENEQGDAIRVKRSVQLLD